jgi:protein ImuB
MQFDTRSLWIYLHFPQLQLDLLEAAQQTVDAQDDKSLSDSIQKSLPRAVVNTSTNALCQINQKAIEHGLSLNMGLASASLNCSDLQLHEYSEEVETNHIVNIANQLYLVTSDIVLAAPNAIILRVQNMLSLYGGIKPYWLVIKQILAGERVRYIAASSYSVQGAKVLALSNKMIISEDRKRIAEQLKQCPLSHTDIDLKDIQKLARIGVKTYADMCSLPITELANRVSRFSMGIINELQGKQAARVSFYQPKTHYHDYLELLYEISLSDKLIPVIGITLDKFSQFLRLRNAHCILLSMQFFQRDHSPDCYFFNSIRPIYKTADWLDIISLKLETIKFDSPVYAISLSCDQYEVAEIANDDMFSQKSTHLASLTLLSRLQSKLGSKGVKQLQFVDDFRPEHSTASATVSKAQYPHIHPTTSIFADRPGLLLPSPEPLQLQVQVINGPERIQTGWWDDQAISRDYYIGQSHSGQQVWIFKTPDQEWFLHGYFI